MQNSMNGRRTIVTNNNNPTSEETNPSCARGTLSTPQSAESVKSQTSLTTDKVSSATLPVIASLEPGSKTCLSCCNIRAIAYDTGLIAMPEASCERGHRIWGWNNGYDNGADRIMCEYCDESLMGCRCDHAMMVRHYARRVRDEVWRGEHRGSGTTAPCPFMFADCRSCERHQAGCVCVVTRVVPHPPLPILEGGFNPYGNGQTESAKSMLNVLSMTRKDCCAPSYNSTRTGPDHMPVWYTTVVWAGVMAKGVGTAKSSAEEAAACAMLISVQARVLAEENRAERQSEDVPSSMPVSAMARQREAPRPQFGFFTPSLPDNVVFQLVNDETMPSVDMINFWSADADASMNAPTLGGTGQVVPVLDFGSVPALAYIDSLNLPDDGGNFGSVWVRVCWNLLSSLGDHVDILAWDSANIGAIAPDFYPNVPVTPFTSGAKVHNYGYTLTALPPVGDQVVPTRIGTLTQGSPTLTFVMSRRTANATRKISLGAACVSWQGTKSDNSALVNWSIYQATSLRENVNLIDVANTAAENPLQVQFNSDEGIRVQGVIQPDTPVWTTPSDPDAPDKAGAPGFSTAAPAPVRRIPVPQQQVGRTENARADAAKAKNWNRIMHMTNGNQEKWGRELIEWSRRANCLVMLPSAQYVAPQLFDDNPFAILSRYAPDDIVFESLPEEEELLDEVQEQLIDPDERAKQVKDQVEPHSGPSSFPAQGRGAGPKRQTPEPKAPQSKGIEGPKKKQPRKYKSAQQARDDYTAMIARIAKSLSGDSARILTWVYEGRSARQVDAVMAMIYGPKWACSEDVICRHVSVRLWYTSKALDKETFLFLLAVSDSQYSPSEDDFEELFERVFGRTFPLAVAVFETEAKAHALHMHSAHGNIIGFRVCFAPPIELRFTAANHRADQVKAAGWNRVMHSGNGNTSWPQAMADVTGSRSIWDVCKSFAAEADYDPEVATLKRGTGAFMNNLFSQDMSETLAFRARYQDSNGITQPNTKWMPVNETCWYALQTNDGEGPVNGNRPSGFSCSAHDYRGEPVAPTKLWSELKNAVQSNQNNQQKRDATMVSGFLGNDVMQEGATIGVKGWDPTPLILRLSLLNEMLIWNQAANFLPVSGGLTGCDPDIGWEPTLPAQGPFRFGQDLPDIYGLRTTVNGPAAPPLNETPVFPFNVGAAGVNVQVLPPPAAPVPGPLGTGVLAFHQSISSVPPNAPRIYIPTWVYECGASRERMLALYISLFAPWPWAMGAQQWSVESGRFGAPAVQWYGHHATSLLLPGTTELHVILPRATVSPNAKTPGEAAAASAIIPLFGPLGNSGIPAGEQINIMGGQQNPTETIYVPFCGYICSWRQQYTTGDIAALLQAMTTYWAVKSTLKWCNQLIAHKVWRTAPLIEATPVNTPRQVIGFGDPAFNVNLDSTANQATVITIDLPLQAQFVADVRIPPLNLTAHNKIVLGIGFVTQALGDDGLAVGKYINNSRVPAWNMLTHRLIGCAWTALAGALGIPALYYNDAYGTSAVSGVMATVRGKWPNKGPGYRPPSSLLMAWVERLFAFFTGGKLRENMYSQSILHSDLFVEQFTLTTSVYVPGVGPVVTACPVKYPDLVLQIEADQLPQAVQGFPINNTPLSTSGIPVPAGRGGITVIGGGTRLAPAMMKDSQLIQMVPEIVPHLSDDELWNKRLFMRMFVGNYTMTDMSATATPAYGPAPDTMWRMMDYPQQVGWPDVAITDLLQTTLGLSTFTTGALRTYPTMDRLAVQAVNQVLNGNNRTTLSMFAGSRGALVDINVLGNDYGGVGGFFGDMLKAENEKLNAVEPGPTTTPAPKVPDVPVPKVTPDMTSGIVMSITGTGLTSQPQ